MRLKKNISVDALQVILALVLLALGLFFGLMAAHSYTKPGFWKEALGFVKLRPLHVTSVVLWIILAAQSFVNIALQNITGKKIPGLLGGNRLLLAIAAIIAIFYSYFSAKFGGREYMEFPPVFAWFLTLVWLFQLASMLYLVKHLSTKPVYIWMWFTGSIFLLITFAENYAWLLPFVRKTTITDMTLQWKSAGSMVGAWNQMIYGLATYLMTKLNNESKPAESKAAYAMYFLGLANLMFNWGHHVYTLPVAHWVRYLSYAVSMTEWIIFLRIVKNWNKGVKPRQDIRRLLSYRFIMAADVWVLCNLFLALCMSIPAINLFTHGTHITVAHSMGTTIGINTMILLGVCCHYLEEKNLLAPSKLLNVGWWGIQISLAIFWISLLTSGVVRGMWQMQHAQAPFANMMLSLHTVYRVFAYSGSLLMVSFLLVLIPLMIKWSKNVIQIEILGKKNV